jgi:hypothetical protein
MKYIQFRAVARFLSWGVQLAKRSEASPRQPTVAVRHGAKVAGV